MNLNSFLGLMGKRVKPDASKGRRLPRRDLDFNRWPLDPGYAVCHHARTQTACCSLVTPPRSSGSWNNLNMLGLPSRQTPYSAFPNPPGVLERTAGATTDIQYLVHQGFTRFGATFWVGANALLKKSALEDICTEKREGARRRFDATFKTEQSSRTRNRRWIYCPRDGRLYNHPERLAYSATPPDFGSPGDSTSPLGQRRLDHFPEAAVLLCSSARSSHRPSCRHCSRRTI